MRPCSARSAPSPPPPRPSLSFSIKTLFTHYIHTREKGIWNEGRHNNEQGERMATASHIAVCASHTCMCASNVRWSMIRGPWFIIQWHTHDEIFGQNNTTTDLLIVYVWYIYTILNRRLKSATVSRCVFLFWFSPMLSTALASLLFCSCSSTMRVSILLSISSLCARIDV